MTGSRMQQVTPMNTKTRLGNAERLGRWLGGLWLGSRVKNEACPVGWLREACRQVVPRRC